MYFNSRSTGDDHFFIWLKGQAEIGIINFANLQVIDIKQFWHNYSIRKNINPYYVLCNKEGNKTFGFGNDVSLNDPYLCYYEEGNGVICKSILEKYSELSNWVTCEISYCQKYLYIGGSTIEEATILILSFDKQLEKVCLKRFPKKTNFREVTSIKRLQGTEILFVGCYQNILVLRPNSEKNKFTLVKTYKWDIPWIQNILIHSEYIITLSRNKVDLVIGKFFLNIDFAELSVREFDHF